MPSLPHHAARRLPLGAACVLVRLLSLLSLLALTLVSRPARASVALVSVDAPRPLVARLAAELTAAGVPVAEGAALEVRVAGSPLEAALWRPGAPAPFATFPFSPGPIRREEILRVVERVRAELFPAVSPRPVAEPVAVAPPPPDPARLSTTAGAGGFLRAGDGLRPAVSAAITYRLAGRSSLGLWGLAAGETRLARGIDSAASRPLAAAAIFELALCPSGGRFTCAGRAGVGLLGTTVAGRAAPPLTAHDDAAWTPLALAGARAQVGVAGPVSLGIEVTAAAAAAPTAVHFAGDQVARWGRLLSVAGLFLEVRL